MDVMISDLTDSFYKFIKENTSEDTASLKLKLSGKPVDFPLDFALMQLSLRSKNKLKLRSFLQNDRFLFPDNISSEQASDELVARYNTKIAGTGQRIIDMTTGLGIDSMTMALSHNHVTSIDIDHHKCEVLRHNSSLILKDNMLSVLCSDSITYCKELSGNKFNTSCPFDVLYIDPARRDKSNRRTYSFSDCEPDIIKNFELLQKIAPRILVKASPLLDITSILNQINDIREIHIVSVRNECKEILVEIENGTLFKGITIIDIIKSDKHRTIQFSADELNDKHANIIEESSFGRCKYLYEPNPALMKVTAYGALCNKFPGIFRLSPNTSLYVSEIYYPDFPGRVLKIEQVIDKKTSKKLKGEKLNVCVRNFPLTAQELAKKLKTCEGKDLFLYAFRAFDSQKTIMLLAKKI